MATQKTRNAPDKILDLGKDFGAAIIHVNGISIGIDKHGVLMQPTNKRDNPTAKELDFGDGFGAIKFLVNGRTIYVDALKPR